MNTLEQKTYFNLISDTYKVNEYASLFTTCFFRRQSVSSVGDYKNKSVLDLMSGRGENIKYIKNIEDVKTITTIDFSEKMNAIAKHKTKNISINQIQEDFIKFNSSQTYDIILCSFGVKTLNQKSIETFTNKASQLLNPNGDIIILELVKPKYKLVNTFFKVYLKYCIPFVFGRKFKPLFGVIDNHVNMNSIKNYFIDNNLSIIKHKRSLGIYEIIHAKKNCS